MADAFAHERKSIKYKGRYIQTYSFGQGERTVFSFPSFPHSGLYYLLFLNKYRGKKVKLITFDLPGWIGYSENFPIDQVDLGMYVDIAKEVLRGYSVDDFSLIGYSFGGALSIRLGAEMKDTVKKVVLVSPVVNGTIVNNKTVKLLKLARSLRLHSHVGRAVKTGFEKVKHELVANNFSPSALAMYSDMLSRMDSKTITEAICQLFGSDLTSYLKDIADKQILVVSSQNEELMFREQAEYIRRLLPTEKSIYLHGTHDDFIVNPEVDTVRQVVNFLAS